MAARKASQEAATLAVTIDGFDMPGRVAATDCSYGNVHVGVQRGRDVVELIAGDATSARWSFPVTVKRDAVGAADFGGPYVHGRPGDRFLYLSWGSVDPEFTMFRRAKLHFADCDRDVLAAALHEGRLTVRVRMTDGHGNPRCARVRAPDAVWVAGSPDG